MRMFIGIDMPDTLKDELNTRCQSLDSRLASRVKWTARDNWHMTLKFLGPVTDDQLPSLKEALATIAFAPFTLTLGEPICFPSIRKPRVIGLGFEHGSYQATKLAGVVDTVVHPLGFEKEQREFKPHLTLGRIKKPASDDWPKALGALPKVWPGIPVNEFVLWESELTPTGPIYHARYVFGLRE